MGFLISNCLEYSALSWSCVPLRCKGSLQGRLKECSLFTLGLSPGTSIGSEEAVLFPRLSFLMALLVCHNQGEVDTVDWRRQWHPTQVLLPGKSHGWRSLVGCSPWGHYESDTTDFTFTFHFHALEKEMATHSSVLAWRIPGMGEPGGLPSMESHRVGHD